MEMEITLAIEQNGEPMANSRDIAAHFEKRHDHVLRDIDALKEHLPSFGEMFIETEIPDKYNRQQRAYLMNRDGFALLAMGFTGSRALEWKVKYINAFNSMEKSLKSGSLALPQDYPSALRALADAEEQRLALADKVEADAPKVLFADAVSASSTSILIGELAKILKQNGVDIGQQRLFQWMRDNGYLIKRRGSDYNMPTQYAMELGLFEIKETAITHADGHVTVSKTPKVTGKGCAFFVRKFLGENRADKQRIEIGAFAAGRV